MKFRLILMIAIAMMLPGIQAYADDVRELNWDDLKATGFEFEDPFEKLTQDQLYSLGTVAKYRQQLTSTQKISESTQAEYDKALAILKTEGVNIDDLLARRAEITEKRRARALTANTELNGKAIRIPGYLLPLEFQDKKVTEFLLVPWVGACIHTPPPPANQIVHVKLDKGFQTDGSLYTSVWVNGVMKTESNAPELSYVDGTRKINVSYVMQADEVELYKN